MSCGLYATTQITIEPDIEPAGRLRFLRWSHIHLSKCRCGTVKMASTGAKVEMVQSKEFWCALPHVYLVGFFSSG